MFFKQIGNLLPRRLLDGVALKTAISKIQLLRLGGFKKLSIVFKVFSGVSLILYFLGYQPTLAIPPIKQAVARAEFSQQQAINSYQLSEPFILPHPGYLTTKFSTWHPGIDIAVGLGMPIHPVASGKVTEATWGFWGLGHSVIVEHTQGFKSIYGHMGRIFAKEGDNVTSASTLGEVGMTGHTSGPHTHLELMKDGKYIDPLLILPPVPDWETYTQQNK